MNEDSKYDIFSIMPRRLYGLKRRGLGRVEGLVGEVEIMQPGLARTSKHPTSMHNCWACRVVLECTYRSRMGVVRRRICHCLSPEGTKGHCSQHTMTIELVNSWASKCVLPNIRIYAKAGLKYKLCCNWSGALGFGLPDRPWWTFCMLVDKIKVEQCPTLRLLDTVWGSPGIKA